MWHAPCEAGTIAMSVLLKFFLFKSESYPLFLKKFVDKNLCHVVSHLHITIAWYRLLSRAETHLPGSTREQSHSEWQIIFLFLSHRWEIWSPKCWVPSTRSSRCKKGRPEILVTIVSSTESPVAHLEVNWQRETFNIRNMKRKLLPLWPNSLYN